MHTARTLVPVVFLLATAGLACASAPSGSSSASSTQRSSSYISASELEDPALSQGSLVDAIRRLRPNFLPRGSAGLNGTTTETEASIDGAPPTALSVMDHMRASDVESVTLLKSGDALQRFGMRPSDGPVLLVILKKH
jgi:hypothetical protein